MKQQQRYGNGAVVEPAYLQRWRVRPEHQAAQPVDCDQCLVLVRHGNKVRIVYEIDSGPVYDIRYDVFMREFEFVCDARAEADASAVALPEKDERAIAEFGHRKGGVE